MPPETEEKPKDETISEQSEETDTLPSNETDGDSEFTEEYDEEEDDDDEDDPIIVPKLKQATRWLWSRRKITLPAAALIILAIVMILPRSRYAVAGMVLSRDFNVVVVDEQTGVPVTDASVTLYGQATRTDAQGVAHFSDVKVGLASLRLEKNYFDSREAAITIGFREADQPIAVSLRANGRLVPVNIVNSITGKGAANVTITAANSSAITNERGETALVLPPEGQAYPAIFMGEGFLERTAEVQVNQQVVTANTFEMTPAGHAYYVASDLTLYRVNLDGSNRQVAAKQITRSLDGFQMKPTADWRFIAFVSVSEDNQKLLLLNTESGEMKEVDGGRGEFVSLIGWTGNRLHYRLTRGQTAYWQASRTALLRYDAVDGTTLIIDQNRSHGGSENDAVYEQYAEPQIVSGGLLFAKTWIKPEFAETQATQSDGIYFIRADAEEFETLKQFERSTFTARPAFETIVTTPDSALIRYVHLDGQKRFLFEDGLLVQDGVDNKDFQAYYPEYILSPGGLNAFWQNKKGQLVVGTQNGQDGNSIEPNTEFTPYGWVTDDYVLVLRDDDLYVMPSGGIGTLGKRVVIAKNIFNQP